MLTGFTGETSLESLTGEHLLRIFHYSDSSELALN